MPESEDELSSTQPFVPQDEKATTGEAGRGVPEVYPDLDVKGELGHGGMGTVFLAREKSASRDVALKVLAPGKDPGDRRDRTRFLEEAQVTAQLQHPGIVPVYRIGEGPQGRPYYTMRPIEGRTLRTILDDLRRDEPATRDRFGLRRLVQVFQFVCQAVRFAHDRGVIHRDLKPANVVVGDYGEVLVIDWGLAKAVSSMRDEAARGGAAKEPSDADVWRLYERRVVSLREDDVATLQATVAGAVMGTPAYMSPEQILGDIRELDARSDIWSLGVLLYELCTLKLPFEGKDVAELTARITKTDPPDPTTVNPQRRVSPELRDVVLRCLRREKSERYASLSELLTDIEHWLEGIAPWRLVKDVDFSREPDGAPEGWTCLSGRWRVSSGVLSSEDTYDDNMLRLDDKVSGDVRVEAEARIVEGAEGEITISLAVPVQRVPGSLEEGYTLQFGSHSNSRATFQRKSVEVAGAAASYTPGKWHRIVAERTGNLLQLSVDGREVLRWRDWEPLSGPWAGLYAYQKGLRVRRYRLFARGSPLTVSCLAVPDAFYEKDMMEDARRGYLDIAQTHPVREEALHALFRAGKCDLAHADHETEPTQRKRFLDEAWTFFDRIERSPLGPLACLGKSLVHACHSEVEKEAGQLERAYHEYPDHEGLAAVGWRLWERTRLFISDPIRSSLFGLPALRFRAVGITTVIHVQALARLPDVALVTERHTDYIRNSASAHHRELATHEMVMNCLWNGLGDRLEGEIQTRIANSEGLALYHALAELGWLRTRQRRYQEALAAYRRIEHDWPSDRHFLFHARSGVVSLCANQLGRYDEAEGIARRIFAEWPGSLPDLAIVHLCLGWALFFQGRFEEAEKEWRHILREWPATAPLGCVHAQLGLSCLALVRGAHDEAVRHLEEAYETWKDHGPVLVALRAMALVHALAEKRDKVFETLRRSADVYPDYAARAALDPGDTAATEAWKLWSAQFKADGELVQGLLAYARGDDVPAMDLLAQSVQDPYTYLSSLFDWPVRRLLDKLSGQE